MPKNVVLHPEISKWRDEEEDKELRKDLKEKGQLQNIIFRKLPDGKLQLLAGGRRYRELVALGVPFEKMQKTIMEKVSEKDALMIAYSENRFRKDLRPVEEARVFKSMQKLRMDVSEIALRVKRSETYVRNRLALLELPEKIQYVIEQGIIEMSYAKPIRRLKPAGEKAQLTLMNEIIKGKQSYYGGCNSVDEAEELVDKILEKKKYIEKLVAKYGPCPMCGSKDISETWEKNQLKCNKCGHEWHKETREPWKYYELKKKAEKIGLKLDIGEGKAKLEAEDVTKIMKRISQETKPRRIPKTLRTTRTISELLAPFIKQENLVSFHLDGDSIRIKLIEDSRLKFSARKHDYQTGEKTQVRPGSMWGDEDQENPRKVKKYIESLDID